MTVMAITRNETKVFNSVKEAASYYKGISEGHIKKCIRDGTKYKGVYFDFVNSPIDKKAEQRIIK